MNTSSRTILNLPRLLLAAAIAVGLLLAPASASADVRVAGSGEPQFTSSTQNTQWVSWQAPAGSDAYRLRVSYYRDNVEVGNPTHNVELEGTSWVSWSGVAQLEEGHTYAICVSGFFSLPNDSLFFSDGPSSCVDGQNTGKRTSTTIDRTKPVTSIQLAGGAAATRSTLLSVSITYSDAQSRPFPANFLCVAPGNDASEACSSRTYGYDAACSQPTTANRDTTFECQVETSGLNPPDGKLFACVTSADSAVPDNPDSANQIGQAGQANLSEKACDSVILDRTAPTAAISAASATVTRGVAATFDAQVSDAHSGVAPGSARWIWNDGTPASEGNSVSHAFPAAGTYSVQLEVADAAGNKTTVSKEITVVDTPSGTPVGGGADPQPTGGETDACRQAVSKFAKAQMMLKALKKQASSKAKIKKAKANVRRANAAMRKACA